MDYTTIVSASAADPAPLISSHHLQVLLWRIFYRNGRPAWKLFYDGYLNKL
ncbi:MAG: hypothetical protein R2777_09455 [Chitinophagales bacterium]